MCDRIAYRSLVVILLLVIAGATQPVRAALPNPSQPILVVQNGASADPYQNFIPEMLTTEGLNGFQIAQLPELTAVFLANYDVVVLPHLALTSAQATLFQNFVNSGGTLIGFRPDLQLAGVFGVASLGTTASDGWLKIDTGTPYGAGLDGQVMKFHGAADRYSLNGATALALLYNDPASPTSSPAAAIYTLGAGKAVLFSFDLAQSIVFMRQGNPAWAGYPNNHDGYNTMRPSQMFMDQGTGQFWNDLGNGMLNDVPQADIQLRLFSNALLATNAAKRPLPRLWYFPDQNRSVLLMTGDQHGDSVSNSMNEADDIQAAGGKFTNFLWYPFGSVSSPQVDAWLLAGHSVGIHFDDTTEVDASGVGGSAATWNGMQNVLNTALTAFTATYPNAPVPVTTRNHFLIWVSRNTAGNPDQTAQARLFQNAGIEFDTSYSAFPNRWGYMTGSGLPMKFLDTATGAVIPVYEQATQYEDDIQLSNVNYSLDWSLATAQTHYQKSLSDSLNKYNTVVTMLFHPDHWSSYSGYAQAALQYARTNSIPVVTTSAWLNFWKARAATAVSKPSFSSNTLAFTVSGSAAGLTLLVPHAAGPNKVISSIQVDGSTRAFTAATYQGVVDAGIVLTAGNHAVSVTYVPAGRILGQISPAAAAPFTTVKVQGDSISATVPVASDGTFITGPLVAGAYTVTPSSSTYAFVPASRPVTMVTADVTGINFTTVDPFAEGQTLLTTQTPARTNATDGPGVNYELGTVFRSDVDGKVTAIRFWKDASETAAHTGRVWSGTGTLLASVAFVNETTSGWQQQALSSPLTITANATYVVTVDTANAYYVTTHNGFDSQVVNGHLSSVVGNNGIYGPPGQFPANSYANSNYFRDIVFDPTEPSTLASLSLNPAAVTGGASLAGTVTLTSPAPAGGAIVTLTRDKASATTPASVTISAGATTATFSISTVPVGSVTAVTITGTYGVSQSAVLTINPPTLSSISLNPATVTGGTSSTGTVTLSGAAAVPVVVSLSDNSSSVNVPATVTVPAGATGVTFTATTSAVNSNTSATITAAYGGKSVNASLAVQPSTSSGGLLGGLLRLLGL